MDNEVVAPTPISKKLLQAASKDAALRAELERELLAELDALLREKGVEVEDDQTTGEALARLLEERGLEKEAEKVAESVIERFSKAHGFEDEQDEELVLDELDAVAGGVCKCPLVGGGTGNGKQCACGFYGTGKCDNGEECVCGFWGEGADY